MKHSPASLSSYPGLLFTVFVQRSRFSSALYRPHRAYHMTQGMWPTVYYGISNRSVASRSTSNEPILVKPKLQRGSLIIDMGAHARNINDSLKLATTIKGEASVTWSTTEEPFTTEEEDAIVTLVVVVVGIIVAIVILFSMGLFIDCKHQQKNVLNKKKLKLKMPPISRRKSQKEDVKSLASDMCPNSATDAGFRTRDVIV